MLTHLAIQISYESHASMSRDGRLNFAHTETDSQVASASHLCIASLDGQRLNHGYHPTCCPRGALVPHR